MLAAAYGLALRGAAPGALRLPPRVRHVAGGQAGGLRPTSCPLPPSVGRYGQHQGCGYARNAHPFALAALACAAASAFALDTALR